MLRYRARIARPDIDDEIGFLVMHKPRQATARIE
jgi:hypothetical protein